MIPTDVEPWKVGLGILLTPVLFVGVLMLFVVAVGTIASAVGAVLDFVNPKPAPVRVRLSPIVDEDGKQLIVREEV